MRCRRSSARASSRRRVPLERFIPTCPGCTPRFRRRANRVPDGIPARRSPMTKPSATPRKPIVLGPGQGRAYPMGRISAVFKADEDETQSLYSVSEWWLEPRTRGPGAHSHVEDDLFYVIEGVMSIRA